MTDPNEPPDHWGKILREPKPRATPEPSPMEVLCAQVFAGGAGKELLRMLRSTYIDARNRPGAPESELREFEAKRQLVAQLEQFRDRGLELMRKSAKP